MFPYIFIISIVSVFSFFDEIKISRNSKHFLIWSVLIILIIFAGTRYETGNDWIEYTKVFDRVPEISDLIRNPLYFSMFRMEPGYILLNSLVKSLGGQIDEVFLISAIFTIVVLFISLKHYSVFCFVAVLLYMRYGYLQTNTMFVRQGIAISLFMYSIKYIECKSFLKYSGFNLIGSLFHTSTVIVFPLYFLFKRKYKNRTILLGVIIAIVLSSINIIPYLLFFAPDFIKASLIGYSESEIWGDMTGRFNIALIEKILLVVICLRYREKFNSIPYFNLFFNIFVFSIICYYAFFQMYVFQQRLSMLFQMSSIIIWIYFIRLLPQIQRIYLIGILNVVIYYFFLRFVISSNVYIPYHSWLL